MANTERMNRRWLSMVRWTVIGLAWLAPCQASESIEELLACRHITGAQARLACFDREAAALASSPKAAGSTVPDARTPASTAAAASQPPAQPVLDPRQQFGLPERAVAAKEVAAGTRAADATKIEAHLARVAPAADGRMVFTLDNDQVWRQVAAEGELLAQQGDAVTISRGWLGSYWLQLEKSGRGCKVTRLR
jgi:hypothetical protein